MCHMFSVSAVWEVDRSALGIFDISVVMRDYHYDILFYLMVGDDALIVLPSPTFQPFEIQLGCRFISSCRTSTMLVKKRVYFD